MNKVTLSVVALAAIGSTVQVQAADLTPAEQITAKQNAIKELRIQVNAASNYIEKNCTEKSVRDQYLLQLSQLTEELNKIYDDAEVLEIDADSYVARINSIQAAAETAQKPYTVSTDLKASYATLKTQYDNALAEAKLYEHVAKTKTAALKALGVEALGEKIAAYDLTAQDIVVDKAGIEGEIKTLKEQITNLMKNIVDEDKAIGNNEFAHQAVVDAYDAAKSDYDAQLQKAIKNLPTPVYEDWQNAAVAELNEQYRIINAAKNNDAAAYAEGKSGEKITDNLDAISAAQGKIATIVDNYVNKMNAQEAANTTVTTKIAEYQTKLDGIKASLAEQEITSCDSKISAVQAAIDNLKSDAETLYKAHEAVSFLNNKKKGANGTYKTQCNAIDKAFTNIKDGKGNTYQQLIDNAVAYKAMVADLTDLKKKIADAETEAKKVSDDGKYNAAEYFTATLASINKFVRNLEKLVEQNNANVAAVGFQGKFNTSKATIENQLQNDYVAKTAASLTAYNTASATVKTAGENYAALDEAVTDKTVTIDGTLTGTTYQAVLDKIQTGIDAINEAVANAEKKADAAHMTAMQEAAKLTVDDGNVQTLIKDYKANKDAYDLASAKNAAQAHINSANGLIADMQQTIDGITTDADKLGAEFAPAVSTEKGNLQTELNTIQNDLDKAVTNYNILVADWNIFVSSEKKKEAAAKVIAELADVNSKLLELQKKVDALEAEAKLLEGNKTAKDNVVAAVAAAQTDLSAIRDYIMATATGDAQVYFLNEITKLITAATKVETTVEESYQQKKAAEVEVELTNKVKTILENAKTLKARVQPNENKHADQVEAAKKLQENWQKAYDTISNDNLSDEAKTYLAELAKLQEDINKLTETTIPEAFAKGESADQDAAIVAENKRIQDAVDAVVNKSKDNYDADVDATNKAQHENFLANYKIARDQFTDAVNALNEFSNIKNEANKEAIDNLVETHDAIYAYADLLRTLYSTEDATYQKYVNDVTDGTDDIYDATSYIETAQKYQKEIDAKLHEYQNKVNEAAKANFQAAVDAANTKVAEYENKIAAFTYKDYKKAFNDVKDVVTAAQTAGKLDADGNVTDRFYAVKVDTWTATLVNNIDKMLEADLVNACDAEKKYIVDNVTKVYNAEVKDINKFELTAEKKQAYLETIDGLKAAVDEAAKKYESTVESVADVTKACKDYYGVDADNKHSDAYALAKAESVANEANLKSYENIKSMLATATTTLNAAIESVNQLFTSHHQGSVYQLLTNAKNQLEAYATTVETWKETGACVVNEAQAKNDLQVKLLADIETLKNAAINNEITDLGIEIDAVKEQYNQVAKEDLDKVKDYDVKIQNLYNQLLINARDPKLEETQASIQWRWENQDKSKMTYEQAHAELLAHEGAISAILNELNAMYTNTLVADATAAIDNKIAAVDEAIKTAEEMASYNEATQEYAPAVNALREALTAIQSDYSNKSANVLFYKDNLLFDLAELTKKVTAESTPLTAEYNKQKTNDDVFAALNADIEKLTAESEASYGRVKDFKYYYYYKVDEEWVSAIEVQHNNMQAAIAQLSKDVESAHKDVVLTAENSYGASIEALAKQIVTNETNVTAYEASLEIGQEVNVPLNAALNVIQTSQYGGDRQSKLLATYSSIQNLANNASNYNDDAWDGTIYNDIDGNYVAKEVEDGADEPIAVDYLAEAWPALQERIAQMKAAVEQLAKDAKELSYVTGDADNDKVLSVNDYTEVRGWILNNLKFEDVSESQRYAGDVDGNGSFSVADMNSISNLLKFGNANGEVAAAKGFGLQAKAIDSESIGMTKVSEETTMFGKTVRIALNVSSNVAFTAGQFDVKLPEGMKLVGQEMTERANGHELLTNEIGDNLHRFVAATIENNEFNGNEGALVVLDVQVASNYAGGEIELSNVIFSDAQANSYNMADQKIGGQATGIDGITTAPTVKERVYSIGGMLMKSVKKGINIIVGEDGKTHKVVKK